MSHKLFRSFLFACLLVCALSSFPAFAQTAATPEAAASATSNADVLTPDQAQRALDNARLEAALSSERRAASSDDRLSSYNVISFTLARGDA